MKRAIVAMVLVLGCDAEEQPRKFADGSAAEQLAECVVFEHGGCLDQYGPEHADAVEQCRIEDSVDARERHFAGCLDVDSFDYKKADSIGMAAWGALASCHTMDPISADAERQNRCAFGWIVASMVDSPSIDLVALEAEICSSSDAPAACSGLCDSPIRSANQCQARAADWIADCNDPNESPVSYEQCMEDAEQTCNDSHSWSCTAFDRCDDLDEGGHRLYPECTQEEAEAAETWSQCDDPLPSWCAHSCASVEECRSDWISECRSSSDSDYSGDTPTVPAPSKDCSEEKAADYCVALPECS